MANKIFIAGSVVGGTGIIHQLASTLNKNKATINKDIYGLIFLRWFRVPATAGDQTVDDGTLDRNMRYGLDYFFNDTRPYLKGALLIGQPDKPPSKEVEAVELEAGKHHEKKLYLHLAAAYGLSMLPKKAVTEQVNGSIYAASFENTLQMYEEPWGEAGREKPLHWYVNRALFVKEIIDYAKTQAFKDEILNRFRKLLGFIKENPDVIGRGLYQAVEKYDAGQRQTKVNEIGKTWDLLSKQYDFSLNWLDEVLGPLPEKFYSDRYKKIKGNRDAKLKEIQTIWAKSIPEAVESPSAPEIARKFHNMLMESFV
jgi:hypothetical protein